MAFRRAYTLVLGIFFLVDGVWGLFERVTFIVLTTNRLHAAIHIILGATGIWAARAGFVRPYLFWIGVILLSAGALWFVPTLSDVVVQLLNINHAVAVANITLGVFSLALALRTTSVKNPDTRQRQQS
jgi:hypothetical protein